MKKTLIVAITAAAAVMASPAAHAQQFINILTGGTSGVYYPLGVAIGKIYGDKIPNVKTQVQATKASVENLNLIEQGRGELAFTLGDSLKAAIEGDEEAGFKTKLTKLRTIGAIYPNYIQIVATADSGVKTLADLKGKTLSVGAPKSGTELNSRAILKAAGLSYKDLSKVEYLPFAESVDLMKNRQLNATLQSAGLGVASLKDLSSSTDIVVVAVPKEAVDRIGPPFISVIIPANTYLDGIEASAPLVSDLYAHERLRKALANLSYDFCFIDTPPSLGWLTQTAFYAACGDLFRVRVNRGKATP